MHCLEEDRPGAPTDLAYSNTTLMPGGKVSALLSWRPASSDSRFVVDKYKVCVASRELYNDVIISALPLSSGS